MMMVRRHTERWADKTPGRELACGRKDRFVLSYSVVFGSFNGLRGLPSVGIGYFSIKGKVSRPTAGYEADWQEEMPRPFLFLHSYKAKQPPAAIPSSIGS